MSIPASKTDYIYRDIRKRIIDGEFPDNSCLPSMRELVEHYGISRTIVRLSMAKLDAEGLICPRRGSGTYIAEGAREKLQKLIKSHGMLKVVFVFSMEQIGNCILTNIIKSFNSSVPENITPEVVFEVMPRFEHYFAKGADLVFIEGAMLEKHPVVPEKYREKVVLINRISEQYNYICTDNFLGGRLMAEALLDCGHKKIGLMHYGMRTEQDFVLRMQGIYSVFRERGLKPAVDVEISLHDYSSLTPYDASKEMLSHLSDFTAVIMITDTLAVHFYNAIKDLGMKIPDDVSLVSLDDLPVSCFFSPPLTTVRQPVSEIGMLLASFARDYAKGEKVFNSSVVPPRLLIRDSVRVL